MRQEPELGCHLWTLLQVRHFLLLLLLVLVESCLVALLLRPGWVLLLFFCCCPVALGGLRVLPPGQLWCDWASLHVPPGWLLRPAHSTLRVQGAKLELGQ